MSAQIYYFVCVFRAWAGMVSVTAVRRSGDSDETTRRLGAWPLAASLSGQFPSNGAAPMAAAGFVRTGAVPVGNLNFGESAESDGHAFLAARPQLSLKTRLGGAARSR